MKAKEDTPLKGITHVLWKDEALYTERNSNIRKVYKIWQNTPRRYYVCIYMYENTWSYTTTIKIHS